MWERTFVAGVIALLALVALTGTARAELVTKADPEGVAEVPNVRRITLDNRQKTAVVRMRYEDLSQMDDETFFIDWGSETYYQVYLTEGAYGDYYSLYLYKDGGSTKKSCYIKFSGDVDEESSGVRVPRSCLKKASDKIRARGIAYADGGTQDETPFTPYAKRG